MNAAPLQHPTEETLRDYGLGKLDAVAAEAAHRHLEACAECRRRVAEQPADSFLDRFRDHRPGESRGSGSPPAAETLPPGLADHPDYEIRRELGRGGMGVVYLAHNRLMGRDEVLKVMGPEIVARPGVFDRFLREMRAVARLRHPNIVAGYAALRVGDGLAFAMEYIPGLDLARMVKIKGPLPVAHACRFAHQAALGLQHAHEAGLVHRDVKPSNLILSHDAGRAAVKVLDFGLTKGTSEVREEVDGALTRSGQALGTPDYIAPEQILDATAADIRADVYSLGATLYFMLAGRPPFRARSLYDLYQAHISRLPDPLDQIRPDVPAELAALISKMMAKDPEQRFQTPKEVAQALSPFFKGRNSGADRSTVAAPRPAGTIAEAQVSIPATRVAPPSPVPPSAPAPAARASTSASTPPPGAGKGHRGLLATTGVGVLLGALAIAWLVGVFKASTSEGTLVLRNLPEDAEVSVDGQRFVFNWPGLDRPLEIRAVAGEKRLEVTKGGFAVFATDLSLKPGGREEVSIRLEPIAAETTDAPALADPSPVVTADAMLRVGSVWDGEQVLLKPSNNRIGMTLKIDSREGEVFEGVADFSNGLSVAARGTIHKDGAIEWGCPRVITWAPNTPEARRELASVALPNYKVVGVLSTFDRTIRAEFVFPGHPAGDWEGTIRLTSAPGNDTAQPTSEPAPAAAGDLLKIGSVWRGVRSLEKPFKKTTDATLTIDSRDGENFEGVLKYENGWSAAARGTISDDGAIRWGLTRVVTWAGGADDARKKAGTASLPDFKASGSLSISDRTIRVDFVRPGQPEGDLEGTVRLELTGDGEPPQGPARPADDPAVAASDMADALMSVGSFWKGEQSTEKPQPRVGAMSLKVSRRDGETFEGIVWLGNGYSTEVRGTISGDGAIRWGYTKVLNWPPTMSEEAKRVDSSTIPNFKASGSLSISDRTIRAEFVRPGQLRGDVEGKIRLKLSEHQD